LGPSGTFLGGSKAFPDKTSNVVKTSYMVNRAQFDADEISLIEKNSLSASILSKDVVR
jgi:hypothetical protein